MSYFHHSISSNTYIYHTHSIQVTSLIPSLTYISITNWHIPNPIALLLSSVTTHQYNITIISSISSLLLSPMTIHFITLFTSFHHFTNTPSSYTSSLVYSHIRVMNDSRRFAREHFCSQQQIWKWIQYRRINLAASLLTCAQDLLPKVLHPMILPELRMRRAQLVRTVLENRPPVFSLTLSLHRDQLCCPTLR